MPSPTLTQKLKDFANKISGTSTINNSTDPTSAAYKMAQSVGKPNPNDPMKRKKPFKPTIQPSSGIGVGP